jgi:iron complex outermembrane receptor protein
MDDHPHIRRCRLRHSLMLATALCASPAARAQTTAPQAEEEAEASALQDIVVTAQRRETRLQDTPIAITAITADALARQGVATVNDLAATVPNLTSTTGPQGSSDANFFVRGVGQFDVIVTNDPGVGVYVDGVYLGRTVGAMLDSGDIERVEVLRGPQGTLFGRNTLGGAISVTSKAPELGSFGGSVRGLYGSRDRFEIDGSINAPLGDIAALRVYAFHREQEGFATRAFDGVKFGRTDRSGARAQLLVQPTDRLSISLSADYSLDKSNPAPSVNLAIAPLPFFPPDAGDDRSDDFYTVFNSNQPDARNEVYGFTGTIAYELGDATLKSITAYRRLDGFSTSDPDGTGYRLYDQNVITDQEQFSQELQIAGSAFGDRLNYLVGGYYFRENADQVLELCFAPITPTPTQRLNQCNTWTQGNDQTTTSYAVFGQASYNLTDQLSVTLGGRYTWDEKTIVSTQFFDFRPAGTPFNPTPGAPPPGLRVVAPIVTGLADDASFRQFTPKLGVEYKPSSEVLIFASYAKGFRSGGFNGRLIAPQTTVPTYAPDTNDSYELGFKADLSRAIRLNATAFYSKYKGIQQTISDPAVQFRVANAGEAELYGFEAELTAAPARGFNLNAALGYTFSEFQDVPAAVGPINGNRLPFSPEWTVALGASYDIRAGGDVTVTPRVDYRYQSRTFFSPFNLPFEQQAPYGLLSARLIVAGVAQGVTFQVYGENLTDQEYYTFGQNALGAQGVAYSYIGRPREFGALVSLAF